MKVDSKDVGVAFGCLRPEVQAAVPAPPAKVKAGLIDERGDVEELAQRSACSGERSTTHADGGHRGLEGDVALARVDEEITENYVRV